MTEAVTYVEIDFPVCSLTYGTSPCTAELEVTGETKCFNTRRTCQDRQNYASSVLTLRFSMAGSADDTVSAIPNVLDIRTTPAVIDPGGSMGQRESVSVSFLDHPHPDVGIDKYLADRDYDPFIRGTFWGKWRARLASLKGVPMRIIRGELGQSLNSMRTWHYVIESTAGPSSERFTIMAKDLLKYADGDRAQAPKISNGQIQTGINAAAVSLTLTPAGIGNLEYRASGKAALGGKEIVSYTRTGDVMTITRGQSNTTPADHDAGEIVQEVLQYSSQTPAALINDLLVNYSDVDPAWIPLAQWEQEVDQWIGRLYSAEIAEPTPVKELINELIEQVGLVMWADPLAKLIQLTALRPVASSADLYDDDIMLRGSYSSVDQAAKRVSQVWTYFSLINPLARLDDTSNYRSAVALIDPELTEEEHGDQSAIKKVFSRWIDSGNRPAATRLNQLLYARFSIPPRRISWSVFCGSECPSLGRGARVSHWSIQDAEGARAAIPVQVVSVEYREDRANVVAEEMAFNTVVSGDGRVVIIDFNGLNINLRSLHDQFYTAPTEYDEVTFIVDAGYTVGGAAWTDAPSLTVGDWPEGPELRLIINGAVRGSGGQGGGANDVGVGNSQSPANDGRPGRTAIYTREPITIVNNGVIAGGGGGGGGAWFDDISNVELLGSGGGGGAGFQPGPAGEVFAGDTSAEPGTVTAGGGGGTIYGGGDGGDPGQPGDTGLAAGGAAGAATDGDDLITFDVLGTILGPRLDA